MLVLSRRRNEKLVIVTPKGEELVVCVIDVRGDRVKLGVEAPADHAIHREEIMQAIQAEQSGQPA